MGKQMGSTNFGYDLLRRIKDDLGTRIAIDMDPKFFGRHLAMVISPVKKSSPKKEETTINSKS